MANSYFGLAKPLLKEEIIMYFKNLVLSLLDDIKTKQLK